jgi:hypothetical protein
MGSRVSDVVVAAAIDRVDAGLDVLVADGWVPDSCVEAMVRVREVERLWRRLSAVQLGLQGRIDRSGVHSDDGHASAKVMVRHGAKLSNKDALRREQAVKVMGAMPAVAAAHADGRLGVSQLARIAKVFANRRVREALIAADVAMCRAAVMLPYPEFDAAIGDWERLADEDGAGDRAERNHANRDFRMPRNLDGSARFEGGGGSGDMDEIEAVWQRQVRREWEADWADARCRLGDEATVEDLARTDAQRRFDAMRTCMARGDLVEYGVEARTCTDLVIDEVTFERHLAKLFGTDPGPDPRLATWWDDLCDTLDPDPDPAPDPDLGSGDRAAAAMDADQRPVAGGNAGQDPEAESPEAESPEAESSEAEATGDEAAGHDDGPGPGGLVGFRCGTIDGRPLDPTEVVVATLIGQVRRVVVGADGVVLDMGRKARCFTGARQLAVRLADRSCNWTGCQVPSSECQCDHVDGFNGPDQGRTSPGNGAPECGRHNRFKERGFTTVRDRTGRWHVFRPDGTEIT